MREYVAIYMYTSRESIDRRRDSARGPLRSNTIVIQIDSGEYATEGSHVYISLPKRHFHDTVLKLIEFSFFTDAFSATAQRLRY